MSSTPRRAGSGIATATKPGPAKPANDDPAPTPPANMAPFRDVPRWVWKVFLSAWASLFGLFVLFFAVNASAAFVITIAALFAMMAFGLPMVLAAQAGSGENAYAAVIETRTGPLSVGAAGAQIVLIPVGAVVGLLAFILLAA